MIKNKVFKNASWIIICKVVQSLLTLVILMFTARYLGPSNFGLINYAASIVAFVVPIMQIGLTNILVQELILHPEEEGKILGTSITMSFISSFLCILGVVSFSLIANKGETQTIIICAMYSILLIFQSFDHFNSWFQAKLISKYTSIISFVAYIFVAVYKIYLLVSGKSILWFAVSNALDYMIISIALFFTYIKLGGKKLKFSKQLALKMFNKSKYYIISSLMVTIFAQTDKIMLKLMINDVATGYYSVAVSCAAMANFIFVAIIDSARPSIFASKDIDTLKFNKNMSRIYCIVIYLSLIQSIFMTIFARFIITILYGGAYSASINVLRLIVWYTTFSYLGAVRDIWILAENKQKYLWIINLSGALANVALNFYLIPLMGIMGAALASLITQIFTNVIIGFIIPAIRQNNLLMIKGLNPKLLVEMVKIIKND